MANKTKIGFGLASSVLFLSACGGMTVENVDDATDEINESYKAIIETNKKLNNLEVDMDSQFEDVLAKDEDLGTISDGSAEVVQNIEEREEITEDMDEGIDQLTEQAEKIGTYEGDELPEDQLKDISDDFLAFSEDLEDYQETYLKSLTVQKDYLDQIAADEADYEDFSDGLEKVNENYAELEDYTSSLDDKFVKMDEELIQLNELIDEANDEENNAKANNDEEESDENNDEEEDETEEEAATEILEINSENLLNMPRQFPKKFVYDSGVDIPYPEDGVKGIYVTATSAGGDKMEELTEMINNTDLNTMVIDIKDDYGNITIDLDSDNELIQEMTKEAIDVDELMQLLDENDIYPIARIVTFKDTLLAEARPEWSFTNGDGSVWSNGGGDSFVNPYEKEVWEYNTEVAIEAAKLGFKDIQFDYVRFPEGFENRDKELEYTHGHYGSDSEDVINMEYRNRAVTDFVGHAKEALMPYGADVSIDIFGYAAVVRETPGIGQSFPGIAEEADVISSMIYPSHWGPGNLDIEKPDLEPYEVVDNYMKVEKEIFEELGDDAPVTRPWLQDFTASYLGAGNYKNYGAKEVNDQIRALSDNGVNEFLLWDAKNNYSESADYEIIDE